jgi:hypothetical protein
MPRRTSNNRRGVVLNARWVSLITRLVPVDTGDESPFSTEIRLKKVGIFLPNLCEFFGIQIAF